MEGLVCLVVVLSLMCEVKSVNPTGDGSRKKCYILSEMFFAREAEKKNMKVCLNIFYPLLYS